MSEQSSTHWNCLRPVIEQEMQLYEADNLELIEGQTSPISDVYRMLITVSIVSDYCRCQAGALEIQLDREKITIIQRLFVADLGFIRYFLRHGMTQSIYNAFMEAKTQVCCAVEPYLNLDHVNPCSAYALRDLCLMFGYIMIRADVNEPNRHGVLEEVNYNYTNTQLQIEQTIAVDANQMPTTLAEHLEAIKRSKSTDDYWYIRGRYVFWKNGYSASTIINQALLEDIAVDFGHVAPNNQQDIQALANWKKTIASLRKQVKASLIAYLNGCRSFPPHAGDKITYITRLYSKRSKPIVALIEDIEEPAAKRVCNPPTIDVDPLDNTPTTVADPLDNQTTFTDLIGGHPIIDADGLWNYDERSNEFGALGYSGEFL